MRVFTKDFKEILFTQIISITGGILAGSFLAFALDKIYLIPGIFILLPGLLDMRGDISGSLSARLGAGLHLGAVKPRVYKNRILKGNIIAAFLLTVIVSIFLGIIAYFANYIIFDVNYPKIILFSVLTAFLASLIEVPLTIITTFWLFRHDFDPNNIMGPYISTTGDVITILSLLLVVVLI